ncbi:hypothetical protein [Pseudescherichia sp.]|uniref:hypothetical protein n=1 Tax=Pseudescherichia sp. TaxID=2055881 RepID=UPI00289F7B0E|nr:hypothetical protein [Pseudescherichia sp.]
MSEIGLGEFLPSIRNYRELLEEKASYLWSYLVSKTTDNRSYRDAVEFESGDVNKIILKGVKITLTVSDRIVFHEKLPVSLTEISFERDEKFITVLKVYCNIHGDFYLGEISEAGCVDTVQKELYREFFDKLIRSISSLGYLS